MADGEKFGEDALSNAWTQGLEELRAANAGEMAMDAPPVEQAEAPASSQPSYEDMLSQQAALSDGRDAPDQGLSR